MKILAIDSSGMTAAVALLEDQKLVAEYNINYKKTHSQTLLPMLDEIRSMTELDLASVDYIAVAAGPGSFTGLRIGSATAKGLALALGRPLVEVPTLEGMACNVFEADTNICPMMDARRSQVYTGVYRFTDDPDAVWGRRLAIKVPQCAVAVEEIADRLNRLEEPALFLGDGATVYAQQLRELVKVPFRFAPPGQCEQRGAGVAIRAAQLIHEGRVIDGRDHKPEYLRLSQAERERANRLREEEEAR